MLGLNLWDYLFIRACIFVLHSIAPLSLIYSLVSAAVPLPAYLYPPRILQVWLALEAIFYVAIYLPLRKYLQRAAKHPTLLSRDDRRRLFWRCHNNIPDPTQYLRKWFRGASEAEIKRENIKDFFRWAFLNTGDPNLEYEEELEEYATEMERLLGRHIEPGRGNANCFRLTLDKVEMSHRSLTWYLVSLYNCERYQARLIYVRFHANISLVHLCCGHNSFHIPYISLLRLSPNIIP